MPKTYGDAALAIQTFVGTPSGAGTTRPIPQTEGRIKAMTDTKGNEHRGRGSHALSKKPQDPAYLDEASPPASSLGYFRIIFAPSRKGPGS